MTPSARRLQPRLAFALVLATALAALAVSVVWAVSELDDESGWSVNRFGGGMMGYFPSGAGEPVRSVNEAKRQAQRLADELDLRTGEVMRFDNHYYVELVEEDGNPATEVLVDPERGAVTIEYGPAMMWNTRYGMMGGRGFRGGRSGGMMGSVMGGYGSMMGGSAGMMGGYAGDAAPTAWPREPGRAVSAADAERIARRWLSDSDAGLRPGEAERFPGYYTLHVTRDGRIDGMLSVNAFTGAVWPHSWHGRFISMTE